MPRTSLQVPVVAFCPYCCGGGPAGAQLTAPIKAARLTPPGDSIDENRARCGTGFSPSAPRQHPARPERRVIDAAGGFPRVAPISFGLEIAALLMKDEVERLVGSRSPSVGGRNVRHSTARLVMPLIAVSYRLSRGATRRIVPQDDTRIAIGPPRFSSENSGGRIMEATHAVKRVLIGTAMAAVICTGLWATTGSGTSSTLVGPPATYEGFKVKREAVGGWNVKIEAKDGLNIATQTITFQPGGQSGWHTHPGPVFISVKEGTMTFYEDDCSATVLFAGQGFLDTGSHPHLARNESGSPATNVVTYFAPPHTTILRIDAPQPLNCNL